MAVNRGQVLWSAAPASMIVISSSALVITGTLVDNAFAAPAVSACGPSGALDRDVNVVGGLPA